MLPVLNTEAAPTAVVWAYRRTGKHAFHVLTGALETRDDLADVPIEFANGPPAVVAALARLLAEQRRVLVGWSFYSPDAAAMTEELRQVRGAIDDARVLHVVGGVHASAEPEAMLRAGFDLVAIGEGEQTICELVATLRAGGDVGKVPGTARLGDDRLQRTPRTERLQLDDWPPVALRHGRWGPIEITRGCIYACKFCQTPFLAKARFRHRSPANIAHWAGEIARAGLRDVRFVSPTSLSYGSPDESVNLAAVEELLARVREALGAHGRMFFGTFPSEVRPEHVTPQALQLLARFVDNDNLVIGGQSGSERVLAASHRGHDVEAIERAVRTCAEHGFKANVDFLLGLPGEEPEDIAATLALVERLTALGAKAHAHTFMPLPGTPFRKAAAGAVDADTRERLESFEGAGHLFGAWRKQAEIALELEQRRAASADPRAGNAPDARAASAIPQVHAREP